MKPAQNGLFLVSLDGNTVLRKQGDTYANAPICKTGKASRCLSVSVSVNGKQKHFSTHRLVAEAYIENPNNFRCVIHKDGDPTNNHVDNLEWVTNSYVIKHSCDLGLRPTLKTHGVKCFCGNTTMKKDGICPKCTQKIQYQLNSKMNLIRKQEKITSLLEKIDYSALTEKEKIIVDMRHDLKTYAEISSVLSTSKQAVEHILKSISKERKKKYTEEDIIKSSNLKKYIREKGISIPNISKSLHLSYRHLYRKIKTDAIIDISTFESICDFLELETNKFFPNQPLVEGKEVKCQHGRNRSLQ